MASIQALLDRYPGIGTGCTLHVSPGACRENVVIGGTHSGLTVLLPSSRLPQVTSASTRSAGCRASVCLTVGSV